MKTKLLFLLLAIVFVWWVLPTVWVHTEDRSVTVKPKKGAEAMFLRIVSGKMSASLN